MTFRAKPVVKRAHRTALQSSSRRTLYLNLFFGGVVVLGVLILAGSAGAGYWNEHFANLATVNGAGINKDQFRDRFLAESFRLEYTERQVRTDQAAGRISDSVAAQQLGIIDQRRQGLGDTAIENLIDATLLLQLAEKEGVSVTDGQITERLRTEATTPERRRAWIISARPETGDGANEPTDAQKATARARAGQMLADIRGGTPFEDVAATRSDEASNTNGGDLGYLNREARFYDAKMLEALFGLPVNEVSDVVEGADGRFYIVRTTEIAPESVNAGYEQEIRDENVNLDAYRAMVRAEVVREALQTGIVDTATKTPSPQRNVSEIFIASDPTDPAPGGQVNASHILYSPGDDPQGAQGLAADDPAWKAAEDEARAAYEELKKDPSKFAEIASSASDDENTRGGGGDLGFLTRPSLDRAFADAIFADGLTPGQILEPVKSSFGWHIIQFQARRQSPQDRIRGVELEAAAGKDFAELAGQYSESPTGDDGGVVGWIARYQLDSVREASIFAAPIGGLTPVITISAGMYLYKITGEESRLPDAEQIEVIESGAFSNWYTARKAESIITRDYQSSAGEFPAQ